MRKSRIAVIFAIIMVLALVLTGCGCFGNGAKKPSAEDAKIMSGKWVLTSAEVGGKTASAQEMGINMSFDFKSDGTTKYTLEKESEEYKWEKDGDLITIWVPIEGGLGSSTGHTAVLDGNSFTLYWDYNGQGLEMVFTKEGSSGSANASSNASGSSSANGSTGQQGGTQNAGANGAPAGAGGGNGGSSNGGSNNGAPTVNDVIGKWNAISGTVNGQPVDDVGVLGSFDIQSGSSVNYTSSTGYTETGIWEYWDREITINLADGTRLDGRVDGNTMTLSGADNQDTITMVLNKQ